jgi:putative transposase
MARKLRVQFEGAIYHVMSRGDRRKDIFLDDKDREIFLATLTEACQKTGWQVHAYCLMKNHFHMVLETSRANLVEGMKWFLGTYTSRFNRKHKFFGHLFSGRYKAVSVDGGERGYLKTVCDYVHLNPVRAKLLQPEELLRQFPWSSYVQYLAAPGKRPAWLRCDRLLGESGIAKDSSAGRKHFEEVMEQRRKLGNREAFQGLRRGWCLGSDEFRQELLEKMHAGLKRNHGGVEKRESAEARAAKLLAEELKRRGWKREQLKTRRKGDREKAKIAKRLREETTMTWEWIAEQVVMGARGHAANRVRALV